MPPQKPFSPSDFATEARRVLGIKHLQSEPFFTAFRTAHLTPDPDYRAVVSISQGCALRIGPSTIEIVLYDAVISTSRDGVTYSTFARDQFQDRLGDLSKRWANRPRPKIPDRRRTAWQRLAEGAPMVQPGNEDPLWSASLQRATLVLRQTLPDGSAPLIDAVMAKVRDAKEGRASVVVSAVHLGFIAERLSRIGDAAPRRLGLDAVKTCRLLLEVIDRWGSGHKEEGDNLLNEAVLLMESAPTGVDKDYLKMIDDPSVTPIR